VFMDHLVRDINAGRFPPGTSLVLVIHGLALRWVCLRGVCVGWGGGAGEVGVVLRVKIRQRRQA
jgi:hypothetical protein